MISRCIAAARRAASIMLFAMFVLAFAALNTSAEGMFETIFAAFGTSVPRQAAPQTGYVPQANAPAAPPAPSTFVSDNRSSGDAGGSFVAYCVRLCDGRYFPLARSSAVSPAEQCR